MYDWLRDYQQIQEEIAYLEYNLERSQKELKRWVNGDLVGVKLTADSDGAKLEERIERIDRELQVKLLEQKNFLELINRFSGLNHKILKLKYVDGMTLEEIAEVLNYSASYIYKKHAEIAKMIKFAHEIKLTHC
ncbi:ECF-type sigma factor [Lysinibacillus pakistanensis]|uniref:ECF-type sigma factor n=1 Tax=Lysinibacillus pakistanensis TaxID=759811 RepID=A0AAX3WWJ3_9BACI|nr:ECF-type sigma factor [Lysinibacillus pakistanensis]MDM5230178.1 ECF-type sigma factor [Lysinibacillus pakistanensis]WHY45772.1 ECF-type sigma factor [Lysinibacillus pakistanensis]WHY50782.1 ECF-type sigma factor [Lysinibacillus pakistanensis]